MLRTGNFSLSKHTLVGAFLCLFVLLSDSISLANENVVEEKYAAFVINAQTGRVLHQENANKILHPASLTKMMTLLMAFEAIDQRRLKVYDRVVISKHAASMIPSKLDLPVGSTIKVRDAIQALTVKSANDVAVALAEKLGGSEKNFAKLMTRKARKLGMRKTRFVNASGLHHPQQVSTARDMSILARTLLTEYEKYYPYFSKTEFKYRGKTYKSHNRLLSNYEGMDGFKTGYIRASGFNLVSSAVRDDTRLIGVVFGGKTGTLRNNQMAMILDQSFAKSHAIMLANIPTPKRKPVSDVQIASLSDFKPAAGRNTAELSAREIFEQGITAQSRWAMLDQNNRGSVINRMTGQGDYDGDVRRRVETGLISLSSHMGLPIPQNVWKTNEVSSRPDWAIQIGAFSSRERSERAIHFSLASLPNGLNQADSFIAPVETQEGWIYRARLLGFTKKQANKACQALSDCIPISPNSIHR